MRVACWAWILTLLLASLASDTVNAKVERRKAVKQKVSKIAFGSCNKHNLPQPAWKDISEYDPDVFIWLGDVVYADNQHPWLKFKWTQEPDAEKVKDTFRKQKQRPEYQEFLSSNPNRTILGIWDDHDYGINNGGVDNDVKDTLMRQVFLDFLDEPKDSERRKAGKGLYHSYIFRGANYHQRIKVILLDTRYDKTDSDILGKEQWRWLEAELKHSKEEEFEATIIASGVQVLAGIGRPPGVGEGWMRYMSDRAKIQQLLSRVRVPGVFFISGDVHFAEMTLAKCVPTPYPLWEFTSSGLTHAWLHGTRLPSWLAYTLFYFLSPEHNRYGDLYLERNWASIDINWDHGAAKNASVTVQIHAVPGAEVVHSATFYLGDMTGVKTIKSNCDELNHSFQRAKPRLMLMMLIFCFMVLSVVALVLYLIYKIFTTVTGAISAAICGGVKVRGPPPGSDKQKKE
eukprot:TRINITY_DN18570_c0_g1_i1.p1 TRINITY_DN18570_c0_g1~~TRINITY_DN18570_c0_g1_i1.p1  ORF type:complete len:457 (-),score=71.02 TRINITY_DN18570_c0_g1_i1:251-1621(-)